MGATRAQLVPVTVASAPIYHDAILCFLTVRNEVLRLPAVLDHHRQLGVNRFLVVDNGSVDGTADYLSQQPDVHLYTAEGSFSESRFGFDWLHPLLDEYGSGHWVLTIDADELFTYPSHEQINLQKLCRYLDGKGHEAMFAILLDMYSDRSIAETSYQAGNSLLDTCPYFDPGPYHVVRCMRFPTFELR
jgi:hypothetical protein